MSRRTRAVTAARNLLKKYAEQTDSSTTYTFRERSFTIHGPDEDYTLRLAAEWNPNKEQEQEGNA